MNKCSICFVINTLSEENLPIVLKNLNLFKSLIYKIKTILIIIKNHKLFERYKKIIDRDKKLRDNVVTLFVNKDIPLSAGRNIGLKKCKFDYIAFVDDDVLLTNTWITKAIDIFRRYKHVVAITGNCIPHIFERKSKKKYTKNLLLKDFYWLIGCTYYDHTDSSKDEFYIKTLIGSNMIFRKKVFDNIGGFNQKLGFISRGKRKIYIGGEDTEISYRITLNDIGKIAYSKKMISYHIISPQKLRIPTMLKRAFFYPLSLKLVYLELSKQNLQIENKLFFEQYKMHALKIIKKLLKLAKGLFKKPSNIHLLLSSTILLTSILVGYIFKYIISLKQ